MRQNNILYYIKNKELGRQKNIKYLISWDHIVSLVWGEKLSIGLLSGYWLTRCPSSWPGKAFIET